MVDRPLLQYVVEEAVASGIEQIILITAQGKEALIDHFDRAFELERLLEQKGHLEQLAEVRRVSELAKVFCVRQGQQLGLGHAVLMAKEFVGEEPFAVLLPDDIIEARVPLTKQLIEVFHRYGSSVIAVERVERERIKSYGIIDPGYPEGRAYPVLNIIEKPEPEEAPSNLGVVGRYILTPEIFEMLEHTPPGKGGEIQLTDALKNLLREQAIYGYEFEGTRYDAGTPLGFLKASVAFALHHPQVGPQLRAYLENLLRESVRA